MNKNVEKNSRWPPAAILNISNCPIFLHEYPILSFCTLFKLSKNTLKKLILTWPPCPGFHPDYIKLNDKKFNIYKFP